MKRGKVLFLMPIKVRVGFTQPILSDRVKRCFCVQANKNLSLFNTLDVFVPILHPGFPSIFPFAVSYTGLFASCKACECQTIASIEKIGN